VLAAFIFKGSRFTVHKPIKIKATKHLTSIAALCPKKKEHLSANLFIAPNDQSCSFPWIIRPVHYLG
jgi:hypothetical protein